MKIPKNTQERKSFKNITAEHRNILAHQYEPLVNKIVSQFYKKVQYDWDSIKSLAYEGLVIAFNEYDPERSKMTFTQYAAFSIKNNILTGLTNELRTVKMTSYGVQQAKNNGEDTFTSVSLNIISGETTGDDRTSREGRYGLFTESKVFGDPINVLMDAIRANFKKREQHMFFAYYGLGDYEEMKAKDLAQYYGVTTGFVSQRIKKVINFIKSQDDLIELLASLMDK